MTTPTPGSDTPTPPSNEAPLALQQVTQETAAAESAQRQALMGLAQALETPAVEVPEFTKGIVVSIELPTMTIQLGGDTGASIAGVRFIDSYSPVVGDTVLIVKSGPDIFAFGQMNSTSTGAANGWVAPALQPNVTTNGNSNGALQYRLVVDNGDYKVQWRGSVALTASATVVCTVPSSIWPSSKRSLVAARNPGGGSNVDQIDFETGGVVRLVGSTIGIADVTANASTGSTTPANTGLTAMGTLDANIQHTHFSSDGPNPATPSSWTTGLNTGSQVHYHNANSHAHGSAAHTHTMGLTITDVASSLWVSFNGLEYFL